MTKIFKFQFEFENQFFFHFPLVVWPIFFQNSKKFNSKFKTFFFHFIFFLWHKRIFSWPEVAKFILKIEKLPTYS
jgi:hypothetical protein